MVSMPVPRRLEALLATHLDPDSWEDFVADLVRIDHPSAEQIRPPDGGADLVLERTDGAHVWQDKFHPGGQRIGWKKCEESLDRAVREHGATEVTFVFPRDLTHRDRKTFTSRLGRRHSGVVVNRWTLSELRARLDTDEGEKIRRRYLGPTVDDATELALRTVKLGGPARDGTEVLDRALELALAQSEADPHFRYETIQGEGELLEPAAADDLFMGVQIRRGNESVRISARKRPGHEPEIPLWHFTDDEEGQQVKADAALRLARGEDVEIKSGFQIRLRSTPNQIAEVMDSLPPEVREHGTGTVSFSAGQPLQFALSLVRGDGSKSKRSFTLFRAFPEGDSEAALAGYDHTGVALLRILFRCLDEPRVSIDLATVVHLGPDAAADLEAIDFVIDFLTARRATLLGRPLVPARGVTFDPSVLDTSEQVAWLTRMRALLADLVEIERRLSLELPIPLGGITSADAYAITSAAQLLREGRGKSTFDGYVIRVKETDYAATLAGLQKGITMRQPVEFRIFGWRVPVGVAVYPLPRCKIVPLESPVVLTTKPGGERIINLHLIPETEDITFELEQGSSSPIWTPTPQPASV
jgi:hypothetical protein